MKITYTGSQAELAAKQKAKLEAKLKKLAKMIGEREVHVIIRQERFRHNMEITMNAYGQALVGIGSHADLVTSMQAAIEKLEKQVLKMRSKWRAIKRHK